MLEGLILDRNFIAVAVLDQYESFIWTDRYSASGDFEFYSPMQPEYLDILKQDYYIWQKDSEHTMIIDRILIESDIESGNHITVTGESLESILKRRIIWTQTNLTGNLQNGIQKLLNENIISPKIADRKIANFTFKASTDPQITKLTVDAQFTGDNLYEAIKSLCDKNNIGFKVVLTEANKLEFSLYSGQDRSYDNATNPYVVFSPEFDNILNSAYSSTKKSLKTVALVAGEGEGADRKTLSVGGGKDLDRYELYADSRDISSKIYNEDGSTTTLTPDQYNAKLKARGEEKLALDENKTKTEFTGEAEATRMFRYNEDFFIGDVVQVANEYGQEGKARITELIFSTSSDGDSVYPTFEMIN